MSLAIDIAWARPDPAAVKARGYSGVLSYISRDASKCLSRAQIDAYHAAGLDVGFVFEDAAERARQGAAAGQLDGDFVFAHLAGLGAPPEVGCYYAVDYQAPPSDHPAIVAYFQAAAAHMAPRRAGAYGDADVDDWARAGGIPLEWGTVAWSGGQASGIALFQRVQQDFGGGADVDEIRLSDWGQWRAVPLPTPTPLPPPAAPVWGAPMEVDVQVTPVTVTVQIQGGHGWCASPAPAGRFFDPIAIDLDPAKVGTYVIVPSFSGVTGPADGAPNGKLVFGKPGDGEPVDGNYSYIVPVITG